MKNSQLCSEHLAIEYLRSNRREPDNHSLQDLGQDLSSTNDSNIQQNGVCNAMHVK